MNVNIDIVVRKEGEYTLLDIVKGLPLSKILGITYRDGTEIKSNPDRSLIKNLDELSFPARHLLTMKKYKIPYVGTITTAYTSRGCPFGCKFCVSSLKDGKIWRARSAENIVDEVEMITKEFPFIKLIFFADDNFMLDKRRVHKICSLLIERKLNKKVEWYCEGRVDNVINGGYDLLKLMHRAGCKVIWLGIESGSQRFLDQMKKGITLKQIKKAFSIVEKTGIFVIGSFMIGYPNETESDIDETIKFATELNPFIGQFFTLTPFPGSPLYYELKGKGMLLTEEWEKYDVYSQTIKHKVDLEKKLKEAYIKFFLRFSYFTKNPLFRLRFLFFPIYYLFKLTLSEKK